MLLLAVVHADQDLEAVAGNNALATVEGAEPPAVQSLCVTLQHRHDVALAEGQLVGRLRHVVIQRLRQHILQKKKERQKYVRNVDEILELVDVPFLLLLVALMKQDSSKTCCAQGWFVRYLSFCRFFLHRTRTAETAT